MLTHLKLSLKMQLRIPISIFFSLVFPILMLTIMVVSYGNFSIGNGYRFVDKYFLISTAIGLISIAFISFPIWVGESIGNDSLKRLKFFGVNIRSLLIADLLSYVVLAITSILFNILVATVFFDLNLPTTAHLFSYLLHTMYLMVGLFLFGLVLALYVRNTKLLLPLGMILLFSIYMFIGVFVPFNELPSALRNIAEFLPVKYLANDFFEIWTNDSLINKTFLWVNTVWIFIASGLVVVKTIWNRGEII